ncbi:MAG: hypothetical protein N3F63_06570 [Thermoplasmata archaeon]|nr:hypothetical protein [Thermoplasmata archaeon]
MKRMVLIFVCGVLIIAAGVCFVVVEIFKKPFQNKPTVEFVEAPYTGIGESKERYNETEIYLGNWVNGSSEKWESYLNIYRATRFVSINTTTALSEAKKYGVTGNNITKELDYWAVCGPEGRVRFAVPMSNINAEEISPFGVIVECGSDSHFPGHDFISDEETIRIAWDFVNTTILNTLPHLRDHLSLKFEIIGYSNVSGGPYPPYTVSKTVIFSLYYRNYWLGNLIDVSINHTGGIFRYTAPTDFALTPEKQIYAGTPQDILNYYRANGINVGKDVNASSVTKVVLEKIEISYKPDTENQTLKNPFERYVPYYYLKYTIYTQNGATTVLYGSLYIKNSS